MGSRTTEKAAAPATEEAVARRPGESLRAGRCAQPAGVLALQRVDRQRRGRSLVARRIHGEDVRATDATGADAWTETQVVDPEGAQAPRALQLQDRRRPRPEDQRGPQRRLRLGRLADHGRHRGPREVKAAKSPDGPAARSSTRPSCSRTACWTSRSASATSRATRRRRRRARWARPSSQGVKRGYKRGQRAWSPDDRARSAGRSRGCQPAASSSSRTPSATARPPASPARSTRSCASSSTTSRGSGCGRREGVPRRG